MADILPQNFPIPGEPQIASYNWADSLRDVGYITFYPCGFGDSSATEYSLIPNVVYAGVIGTKSNVSQASFTKKLDLDFDVLVNYPITLRGDLIANIPTEMNTLSGSAGGGEWYVIAKLRKWDGTTETEIASNTSDTTTQSLSNYKMFGIKVPVTKTNYAIGEYIRVTIEVWAKVGDGSKNIWLGHDPQGRSTIDNSDSSNVFSGNTSAASIQIPFKIEK